MQQHGLDLRSRRSIACGTVADSGRALPGFSISFGRLLSTSRGRWARGPHWGGARNGRQALARRPRSEVWRAFLSRRVKAQPTRATKWLAQVRPTREYDRQPTGKTLRQGSPPKLSIAVVLPSSLACGSPLAKYFGQNARCAGESHRRHPSARPRECRDLLTTFLECWLFGCKRFASYAPLREPENAVSANAKQPWRQRRT